MAYGSAWHWQGAVGQVVASRSGNAGGEALVGVAESSGISVAAHVVGLEAEF
ncbi:MAG: hypothetical protein Q4A06_10820 [Cardiobacteriaceae bacterium]|nr:hypothetical protein [Cardiobacteriaceae bacterium]